MKSVSELRSEWWRSRLPSSYRYNTAVAASIGIAALAIAFSAHLHGRPVTAALLAVFGVTAVGALLGVRAGIIAGIAASLIYNLLLTEPILRFSLSSADDLVPIIALNVSAIASGIIAGRLHDRAVAAETSSKLVAELLAFSQSLQQALTLNDIGHVARHYIGGENGAVQLFVRHEDQLSSTDSQVASFVSDVAHEVWNSGISEIRFGDRLGLILASGGRRIGVLVVDVQRRCLSENELRSFVPLLELSVERWLLASELSEADAVKRSEAFKTALLSSVSHDLRTPLAAISASASSLTRFHSELDGSTRTELLQTIEEQCERLDRLTANLLNLGRIEGGLDIQQMSVIDAVEVLGSALAQVRPQYSSHRFEKDLRTQSAAVRADEPLLEQVFLNVLQNAAVHTSPGTTIRVSTIASAGSLVVSIEDDGAGIPEADRNRVFERFFQGGRDGRVQSGSGLGLSIAKGFAERVGGAIRACAAAPPMGGARIEIMLPLAELTHE